MVAATGLAICNKIKLGRTKAIGWVFRKGPRVRVDRVTANVVAQLVRRQGKAQHLRTWVVNVGQSVQLRVRRCWPSVMTYVIVVPTPSRLPV